VILEAAPRELLDEGGHMDLNCAQCPTAMNNYERTNVKLDHHSGVIDLARQRPGSGKHRWSA
jgi:hypothetical protein